MEMYARYTLANLISWIKYFLVESNEKYIYYSRYLSQNKISVETYTSVFQYGETQEVCAAE